MSKINPFSLTRPKPKVGTFTFTDDRYPDLPVTMTFRSPDILDYSSIEDAKDAFMQKYSDKDYPSVDGKIVVIGPTLARTVASMWVLQETPEAERYDMDELVAMSITIPSVFGAFGSAIKEISDQSELGNLITDRQSPDPSSNTPKDIQN